MDIERVNIVFNYDMPEGKFHSDADVLVVLDFQKDGNEGLKGSGRRGCRCPENPWSVSGNTALPQPDWDGWKNNIFAAVWTGDTATLGSYHSLFLPHQDVSVSSDLTFAKKSRSFIYLNQVKVAQFYRALPMQNSENFNPIFRFGHLSPSCRPGRSIWYKRIGNLIHRWWRGWKNSKICSRTIRGNCYRTSWWNWHLNLHWRPIDWLAEINYCPRKNFVLFSYAWLLFLFQRLRIGGRFTCRVAWKALVLVSGRTSFGSWKFQLGTTSDW